jgi:hypothetical protein
VVLMGEERNAYRLLVGKRPLGRPRCRRMDGSWRDRTGWLGLDWSGSG